MSFTNSHENAHSGISHTSALRQRPLTSRQERKLVEYLDENILELTRHFKKRSEETSALKTLSAYIEAVGRLLALILQIPPLDPSTGLRIAYLLRLTGDLISSIPGYKLGRDNAVIHQTLQDLIDFLDDLDQAWLSVLQGQVWDPETREGVDLVVPVEEASTLKSTPASQTDLTRLRSLLFTGQSALEEWLSSQRSQPDVRDTQADDLGDVSGMLSRMGLFHEFDSLFSRTLDFLGGFGENISRNILDPQEEGLME
ncbi:hypothetical protein CPB84DRAFT_1838890 [Gymnopilus junonius]|uniref:Uncharacterized protein n=1 Tax=Gymnopilus junonius TaxID=109634 RepID=A0A9P5N8C4_GYMJU|nr:hypothetical protein CPB84DRAFT_1838890 [Gymnopilus junonius]